MAAAFAALESRVNATVFARLSNVIASIVPFGAVQTRSVLGIFHDAWVRTDGMGMPVTSSTPALELSSDDVPAAWKGATVRVRGDSYDVVERHDDGAGVTVLVLHEA